MIRKLTLAVVLLGACASSFAADTAPGEHTGAACLAPFPADREVFPHAVEHRPLTAASTFGFRFGKYQTVLLKQGQSAAVSSLPLNQKIRVSVSLDGKPYESFALSFAEMKTDKVCMWLKLPYATWQVSPYSDKGHGCKCFG